MDTGWLEDFIRLADEGNFSRAAEARNLSQPAFSRRIKALEDWVGAVLVDRDTHRIGLTEAGDAFRSVADEVLRRLALGRNEAREIGGGQANILRFAATHALSVTFFPQWLRSLETSEETGTVSLVADNMVACEALMIEGRADFLLCHHHPAASHRLDPGGFRSIAAGEDTLIPVCAVETDGRPRFLLPGDPKDLLPYLEFDEQSGMGRILTASNLLREQGAALRPVFRSHLANVLLTMAREGRGIAWAPRSLANIDIEAGRLARAGDARWDVPIEIRLFRPKARRSAVVEALWDRLLKPMAPGAA